MDLLGGYADNEGLIGHGALLIVHPDPSRPGIKRVGSYESELKRMFAWFDFHSLPMAHSPRCFLD
jgi:hypothetical protein